MKEFLRKILKSNYAILGTALVFVLAGSIQSLGLDIVLLTILLVAWAIAQ